MVDGPGGPSTEYLTGSSRVAESPEGCRPGDYQMTRLPAFFDDSGSVR